MKKLLFQKFLKDTFKFFIIMGLSLGMIVWVVQAVNFLDFVTEDGHGLYVYFQYTLLSLPKIFHRILPFIFFISLFYQISQYESNNELLIFWTNGVSKLNFTNIVIFYSIMITLFQIFLGSYVSPTSQKYGKNFIRTSNIDYLPSLIKEGKFIDTVKDLTIFIEKKDDSGAYKNIFLNDAMLGDKKNPYDFESQIVYAKKGILLTNKKSKYFRLFDGYILNNNNGTITTISFEKIDFNLNKYQSKTIKAPKLQEINSIILFNCIFHHFKETLNEFQSDELLCNDNFINNVKQEFLKRFYKPIYLPLFALISCLLLFVSKENEFYGRFKLILFVIVFFVIIFSETSLRYVAYGQSGLIIFLSFPVLFFIILYTIIITKFNNRF